MGLASSQKVSCPPGQGGEGGIFWRARVTTSRAPATWTSAPSWQMGKARLPSLRGHRR